MKIGFIFGKGVDGCGVTRGAQIFEKWIHDNKIAESLIVDFNNEQAMSRARYVEWKGKVITVNTTPDVSNDVVNEVNKCDIVVVHSYPTRKQDPVFIERFRKFLERVSDPIIVCHDHAISKINMSAIPQANELYSKADIFVPQSLSGDAARCLKLFDPDIKDRIIENPIWINPSFLDQYRKPHDQRDKHFMYIGRMSPLKDPAMICRAQPYLSDWNLSFIGCERSISSVSLPPNMSLSECRSPYIPEYQPMIKFHRLNKDKKYVEIGEKERLKNDAKIFACDSYEYPFGMKTLGSSFASWCGYTLTDKSEYGSRMEYTMIESFLLSLPILSDDFVNNAYAPNGKLWKNFDFIISSSAKKEKELADELNRLWSDKKEWKDRTEACQRLVQEFNDIDNLAPRYLEFILSKGKRSNKISAIDKISEYFPEAKELRNSGEIVISNGNSVKNRTSLILVDGKQSEYKSKKEVNSLDDFFT